MMRLSLADFLSLSRIALAYPLYHATVHAQHAWVWLYLAWMALSDFLDGWYARQYQTAGMGAWLDPSCDAVAMVCWIGALWQLGCIATEWLYFWMLRYLFFVVLALKRRYQSQEYMAASQANKISVSLWALFSIHAWHTGQASAGLGGLLAFSQLLSMWLALRSSSLLPTTP